MARKRMRSRAPAGPAKPAGEDPGAQEHDAPARAAAARRKAEKKPELDKIRKLENELQAEGSSKVNNLVELLEYLGSADMATAKAALHSLRRLFTCGCPALDASMRSDGDASKAADVTDPASKAAKIYETWVRDRYASYKQALLVHLAGCAEELQTVSLVVLMQLAKQESTGSAASGTAVDTLGQVVRTLLLHTSHNADTVVKMYVRSFADEYDDVRFHTLKATKATLSGLQQQGNHADVPQVVHRALTLLLSIGIPEASRGSLDNFWFSSGEHKKLKTSSEPRGKRVTQVRSHRKAFGDCWTELLRIRRLDVASYRRVLLGMHDQILPHLPHPLLLSDFLTDAYNQGGAVSMLAMHGLFVLMAKHGLEYPQFYPRLYALMKPAIFHLTHRDQFFRLTDLFLTSKGKPD
jgi:U3 small nucleolar RNA-associated protein 19